MSKIPGPIKVTILEIGPQKFTPSENGNTYIECSVLKNGQVGNKEQIAFWGTQGKNVRNLRALLERNPPFNVSANFGWIPNANYADRHSLWIPEAAELLFQENPRS